MTEHDQQDHQQDDDAPPAPQEALIGDTWVPVAPDALDHMTFDDIEATEQLLDRDQRWWTHAQKTRVMLWLALRAARPQVEPLAHWLALGGMRPDQVQLRPAGGPGPLDAAAGDSPAESSSLPSSPTTS